MGVALPVRKSTAVGQAELVCDAQHFYRIIRDGILKAEVSRDTAMADFVVLPFTDHRSRAACES